MLPVTRFAMTMHDRNDKDVIALDRVQNRIGKNFGWVAAHITFKDAPQIWRFYDMVNCTLYGRDETQPQAVLLFIVLDSRCLKFT